MRATAATNHDEYIAEQLPPFAHTLSDIRRLVHQLVPDVQETISYQIPCFKTEYMLVGMGINAKGVSFHTMSPDLVKRLKPKLEGVTISGATLHLEPGKDLPEKVLSLIIQERVRENQEKAAARKK